MKERARGVVIIVLAGTTNVPADYTDLLAQDN